MEKLDRRKLFASLAVLGGGAVIGANRGTSTSGAEAAEEPGPVRRDWQYTRLNPEAVSERTYRIYPNGGCMYAVVGSVIGELADRHGEPFRSFPCEMMRYGAGGVGEWGSLCGVVNGANALVGLFHSGKEKHEREQLAAELCSWYENTALPHYQPAEPAVDCEIPASVAGSVLCHISVAKWCQASNCDAFTKEKKERCRRLAADGAKKVVEVLNREAEGISMTLPVLSPAVESCVACHGKSDMADATGRMSCQICHQFDGEHP